MKWKLDYIVVHTDKDGRLDRQSQVTEVGRDGVRNLTSLVR